MFWGKKWKAVKKKETNSPSTSHRETTILHTSYYLTLMTTTQRNHHFPHSTDGETEGPKVSPPGNDREWGLKLRYVSPPTFIAQTLQNPENSRKRKVLTQRETLLKLISPGLQENPITLANQKQSLLSVCCKLPATCIKEVYVNRLMHLCHGQNYYQAKKD